MRTRWLRLYQRMKRRLFNLIAALSLLLCVAISVARVRQPRHTACFSTSLPGGRLLIVLADERFALALWRDWPAWEWPAVHQHVRYRAADYCGPLVAVTGRNGASFRAHDFALGVRRQDVVAEYGVDGAGKPHWPERRPPDPTAGWFRSPPASDAGAPAPPAPPPPPRLASYRQFLLPYWMPIAATAALPALWLGLNIRRRVRSRRRLRAGLCVRCGYDLTGNVSGACPECGAAAGSVAAEERENTTLADPAREA